MKNLISDELRKRRGPRRYVNYCASDGSMLREGSSQRIKGLDVSAREHILSKLSNELQVNLTVFVLSHLGRAFYFKLGVLYKRGSSYYKRFSYFKIFLVVKFMIFLKFPSRQILEFRVSKN